MKVDRFTKRCMVTVVDQTVTVMAISGKGKFVSIRDRLD